MSAIHFTRRQAAAAALGWAALWAAQPATARTAAGGIHVDVSPLMENSGEPTAGWVARELPAALAAAGVSGPISVRIDYVILGPNSGGVSAGSSPDQMIGEVTRGGVTTPLRASSSYYPSPVDNTMIERSNFIRVSQLCRVFAEWVARGY